jgi:uncharacterized protein with gpF-like domain
MAPSQYERFLSYSAKRWEQAQRTKAGRPYLQFMTVAHGEPLEKQINVCKVRPSHAALDGIIRPIDDPIWKKIYPPIDDKCRCMALSVSQDEMDAEGLHATSDEALRSIRLPQRTSPPPGSI